MYHIVLASLKFLIHVWKMSYMNCLAHTYTQEHTQAHTHRNTHRHTHSNTHEHTHTHAHTRTRTHTGTHVHKQAHTQTQTQCTQRITSTSLHTLHTSENGTTHTQLGIGCVPAYMHHVHISHITHVAGQFDHASMIKPAGHREPLTPAGASDRSESGPSCSYSVCISP